MGIYDRDYLRDSDEDTVFGGPRGWSVVTWLLAVNTAVHLVKVLVFDGEAFGTLNRGQLLGGEVWRLVTYMFIHDDWLHLIMNMLILWFAGQWLVRQVGTRAFLVIYFGGGVVGALAHLAFLDGDMMGASAACMAVFTALATLMPERVVAFLLFFIIPIQARFKTMALILAGIELLLFLSDQFGLFTFAPGGARVAHLAHLGGMLFGFLFVRLLLPLARRKDRDREKKARWKIRFGARRVVDAEVASSNPAADKPFVSTDVDAILDKISARGMQSLTEEEKRVLQRSSEKLAKRVNRK